MKLQTRRYAKSWLAIYNYNHYIMWKYLVTKKEDVEKLILKNQSTWRVRKFQTWSYGRPWFSLNCRHERLTIKCIVCIMFGIANKNYVHFTKCSRERKTSAFVYIKFASLQNSPLVGNFWFAFYFLSYRINQYEHLEEKLFP